MIFYRPVAHMPGLQPFYDIQLNKIVCKLIDGSIVAFH